MHVCQCHAHVPRLPCTNTYKRDPVYTSGGGVSLEHVATGGRLGGRGRTSEPGGRRSYFEIVLCPAMRYYRVLVAVGVVLVAGACAIKPCDVVRNMTAAVNRRAAGEIVSWFAPNATLTTIHPNMSLVLNGSSAIASVVRGNLR